MLLLCDQNIKEAWDGVSLNIIGTKQFPQYFFNLLYYIHDYINQIILYVCIISVMIFFMEGPNV